MVLVIVYLGYNPYGDTSDREKTGAEIDDFRYYGHCLIPKMISYKFVSKDTLQGVAQQGGNQYLSRTATTRTAELSRCP